MTLEFTRAATKWFGRPPHPLAERGIMAMHEKMAALTTVKLAALLRQQQDQIDLLAKLLDQSGMTARESG